MSYFSLVHLFAPRLGLFRLFDLFFFSLLVMTLHGTAKVNESSQSEMAKKSQLKSFTSDFWCDTTIKKKKNCSR
jgi:hypothetical protein